MKLRLWSPSQPAFGQGTEDQRFTQSPIDFLRTWWSSVCLTLLSAVQSSATRVTQNPSLVAEIDWVSATGDASRKLAANRVSPRRSTWCIWCLAAGDTQQKWLSQHQLLALGQGIYLRVTFFKNKCLSMPFSLITSLPCEIEKSLFWGPQPWTLRGGQERKAKNAFGKVLLGKAFTRLLCLVFYAW